MPELPEMENYKQLLTTKLKDNLITEVEIQREKSINVKVTEFQERVKNKKITQIERKAKHLLFHLDSGEFLLLHLMLGGWMYIGSNDDKPNRTIQITLSFVGGMKLYFIGLRLGYLHLLNQEEVNDELADLGPEPLNINFSLDTFFDLIRERRGKLKTTLVDQQFLSGIGNRYSDEICWHAKILPTRKVNDLKNEEVIPLFESIRHILQQGIDYGGYMDEPVYKDDDQTGGYLNYFNVYDREGKSCNRCQNKIKRTEISSRKSFYCIGCQH